MKKLLKSKKFVLTTILTVFAGFLALRFIGHFRAANKSF